MTQAATPDDKRGDVALLALSRAVRPEPALPVSEWAERFRRVPAETSQFPGKWSNATAPYLTEIMDVCGPHHPAERVVIRKSAQVGYSEALTNVIGAFIDTSPGPMMAVHPTIDAAKNWTAEKLDATIQATRRLRDKVLEQVSRDGAGSTTKRKRFPGGFLIITGANSTRELRQRSVRALFKDDWSDWPLEIEDQGDPDVMAEARTLGFQSSGNVKIVEGSTPTNASTCRVTASYASSDRRIYLVPCPHCGHEQELRFFGDENGAGGLRWDDEDPLTAAYACEGCGALIAEHAKRKMVAAGRWHATAPGPGRYPGFALNSLYSPFTTWSRIVDRYLRARGNTSKLKTFWNLDLGLAWEERGDAPLAKDVQERTEDYPLGVLPPGALVLTIGVDVQKAGLYYEALAWGPRRETWSIGADFLEGETGDRDSAAWKALDALLATRWKIAGGAEIVVDMLAIDANFNTDAVCDWVRGRAHTMAVRGVDGWDKPVFGRASKTDVNWRGDRKKRSAKIHPVYVWNLKQQFYADLGKAPEPGATELPPGFCHFPTAYPAEFFTQLTADYMREVERRGRRVLAWTNTGANHFHDCRIYAMAAFARVAQRYGLQHANPVAAWQRLEEARRPPAPAEASDPAEASPAPVEAPPTAARVVPRVPHGRPFLPGRGGFVAGWR